MATLAHWIEGARPRTLPNAVAPVLVGAGAAAQLEAFSWLKATLALVVALTLVLGVNYANDYSDGIRGTDDERVGPLRLTGSGVARPQEVLAAALSSFALAGVTGLVLIVLSGHWWLLAVGTVSVAAAWFYTGGTRPYGYAGLGEIAVFIFFGLVAVLGTVYVQAGTLSVLAVACAVAVGAFSAAVLLTNNLRDIPSDTAAGKRTLAVRLGDKGTRRLYLAVIAVPFIVTLLMGALLPPALLAAAAAMLIIAPARSVLNGARGSALIKVLRDTGIAMLAWAAITAAVLAFGS